jgi:uncharacterized protein
VTGGRGSAGVHVPPADPASAVGGITARPITARPITARPITAEDVPALAALNDAAVPAVNRLGRDGLAAHVPRCTVAVTVPDDDGDPLAFVLGLAPGTDYDSENYRWFSAHRPGSLYVDRIVVAPHAHGRGLGRLLYAVVERTARSLGLREITCEVNLDPPNPGSLAFHSRLGFTAVGEQVTKGGAVRVALLARPV